MYAVMVSANKKARYIGGMENAFIHLTVSFLTSFLFFLIKGDYTISLTGTGIVWILILGLLDTGFGCYLYFSSIGLLPVQTVAICGYLEPLSAVIFAAVLLGERFGSLQAVGAVLIAACTILSGRSQKD